MKRLWLAAALLLSFPSVLPAGGPLVVSGGGTPYVWDLPVRFRTDRGGLGTIADPTGFVNDAFAAWTTIPTTNVSVDNLGLHTVDINTVSEFNAVDGCTAGDSVIVFDANGQLFTLLGFSSGVIGFAGPSCIDTLAIRIVKGVAALNGKWQDGSAANGELTADEFFGTFVHEFGHFLNLDHSQTNGHYFIGDVGDPGFVTYGVPLISHVEIMFPFALDGMSSSPKRDDAVAISTLYPAATFASGTGAITGVIRQGSTPFQGANVIARNAADPFADAASNVSGARFSTGAPGALRGLYEIPGLTPGADYTVEVVRVNPQFTGGSSVGPLSPPAALPGPEEFYNGPDEGSASPPDDPLDFTVVPSVAGVPTTGIDIVFNAPTGPPLPPLVHDLAVTKITAPARARVGPAKLRVAVRIQNRGHFGETIPNLATLGNLVQLQVLPIGGPCAPAPVVTLRQGTPQHSLPYTLAPKGVLDVFFDVVFRCANDPARGVGHEDYRYVATVSLPALPGGEADDHPVDDVCPRNALATPGHRDPYPDGSIVDKGCGARKPDGTFGADVKTDVYVP